MNDTQKEFIKAYNKLSECEKKEIFQSLNDDEKRAFLKLHEEYDRQFFVLNHFLF